VTRDRDAKARHNDTKTKEHAMIADLAMQKALDRYHQAGIPGLTDAEKTLAAIWYFESKLENGGFEHFLQSKEGELAALAPAAFRAVNAEKLAQIAERANAIFGANGVPARKEERAAHLKTMGSTAGDLFDQLEREYEEADTDLDERIEAYLTRSDQRA
jgi:hypothetical protein